MSSVKVIDHLPAQPVTAMPIEHILDRMVRDTSLDFDRLERMIVMQQEAERRRSEREFAAAMVQVQARMRAVGADASNPQTHSKYATYYALDKMLRPLYTQHGFVLSFDTEEGAPENHIRVVCYLLHDKGFSRRYHVDMPADGKGARGGDVMSRTHAVGSAMTYGQRYLLRMIFNVAIGQDDDGNGAGDEPITEEQVAHISSLIMEVDADIGRFCRFFKIAPLPDLLFGLDDEAAQRVWLNAVSSLPSKKFAHAVAMLESKRKQ